MSEIRLLQSAMDAFSDSTGLTLLKQDDAEVALELRDKRIRFLVECKSTIDRPSALSRLKATLATGSQASAHLLVTRYLTPALAEDCRRLQLNFIDTAGNCHLSSDDLLIFIKGNKPSHGHLAASDYRGGTSASSLRMIFALICQPALLTAPYRDIVNAAGIALGSVGWIFRDLEDRGLVTSRDRDKRRHFIDLARLQEEWATNYPHKLRPRLSPRRFSAAESGWWSSHRFPEGFLWGGETASFLLDGHLKPASQTLYVAPKQASKVIASLAARHHWRADPTGPIEVVDTFWKFDSLLQARGLVPPLLIYADLLALLDSRAAEAAALLWKNHLDVARHQA